MTQASVRRADRIVIQFGQSIGPRDDCDLVDLTDAQTDQLRTLLASPNGGVTLQPDGSLSALPAPVRPPDPFAADAQRVIDYMPASGTPIAQAVSAYIADTTKPPEIRATMAALRSLIRVLRGLS